jgi:homogentisate phytyltransferase/homogentisate geranylgeranyltransferase
MPAIRVMMCSMRLLALTLFATNLAFGFTFQHQHHTSPAALPVARLIRSSRLLEPSMRSTRLLMTGPSTTNSSTAQYASTTADATDFDDNIERPPFPIVLWRFTRPHTLIGSALAIPALHLLAASSLQTAFTWRTAASVLYAMVPSLLMNLYITGLNQITDVEIDKINKPNLPIAAGILSQKTAIITVSVALLASLWMGAAHPLYSTQGLNVALWGSGILGTLYSVEPFRLKRHPLLAAFCIVAVRGTIINAGFYAHARQAAFGETGATVFSCLANSLKCGRSSLFFAVFGVVIALMKDVPDVLGDESSNVRTFSVRVGQKRIFHAMRRLLTGLFVSVAAGFAQAIPAATNSVVATCRGVTAVLSLAAAWSVRKEAAPVDPEDPKQVYSYYMHLWKIFYLSYLVLPFAR